VSVAPLEFGDREGLAVQNVFILTDGSGTMWVNRSFPAAKAQTQSFVAAMPDGDYQVSTIGFGGDDRISTPLSDFDRRALERDADSLTVLGALDGRGGTTPLHEVFYEIGLQLEGRTGDVAIVLFTDGVADEPGLATATLNTIADLYPARVCFHGVQVGDDAEGAAFLRELAAVDGCGSFRTGALLETPSQFTTLSHQVFAGSLPPVGAAPNPCTGNLRLGEVEFGFDKASITESGSQILELAAVKLDACPDVDIAIDGYTDSTGPDAYNKGLSKRRAEAARKFLIEHGVDANRLTSQGFGSSHPVAPNDTEEGRALNRRVELHPAR
jgi:OOP family OmpA-OmpF porin